MHSLILLAMQAEAQPTIDKLGLVTVGGLAKFPSKIYTGHDRLGNKISLVVGGTDPDFNINMVGPQSAAAMAALGIAICKPDIVINAGTAGGFNACGARIGGVYIVEDYLYHDRRIPLAGFNKYGIGGYHVALPDQLTSMFHTATATTGSSLDITPVEYQIATELAKTCPLVKDMESAAIAEVCAGVGIPLISLKSITDMIDGGKVTDQEFTKNLHLASKALQVAIDQLLDVLSIDLVNSVHHSRNFDLIERVLRLNKKHNP